MKKLSELLTQLDYECVFGNEETTVSDLSFDSRKAKEGGAFFCFVGANSDGHDYIPDVIRKGVSVIVVQKEPERNVIPDGVTVIKVPDTRYALGVISAEFFDHPAKKMLTIGITGTKGKTSTATIIQSILNAAGHKTGIIGTVGVDVGGELIKTDTTTPESLDIEKYFCKMLENGCDACVMEVSSQALMLHRVAGIEYDYGLYTNLSPDHIGGAEHKDLDDYIYCKSLLFKQCKVGFFNVDDEHCTDMMREATCEIHTFSCEQPSELQACRIEYLMDGEFFGMLFRTAGTINSEFKVSNPGVFSVYNALAAVSVCKRDGADIKAIKNGLASVVVKGRMEPVNISRKFSLFIDYAHNAMAMEHILKTMRQYGPNRLISLFGCGGNRSKLRRYEMGEISGKYADLSVVTEDNSRLEKVEDIIDDILTGMKKTDGEYIVIPDRKEAIKYCILNAREGDIILLLGKGHEDYQDKNGKKTPFDERVIIQEILDETGWVDE